MQICSRVIGIKTQPNALILHWIMCLDNWNFVKVPNVLVFAFIIHVLWWPKKVWLCDSQPETAHKYYGTMTKHCDLGLFCIFKWVWLILHMCIHVTVLLNWKKVQNNFTQMKPMPWCLPSNALSKAENRKKICWENFEKIMFLWNGGHIEMGAGKERVNLVL